MENSFDHGSLFSGIGGFDLAAEWAGWENKFHCEVNDFGRVILKYYWPHAKSYYDIKTTDFHVWRGRINVLSGGFPCQPYSQAGSRKGNEDERHLWPEMLRAVREIRPSWVVGENVRGITNWNGGMVFDEIQADLEIEGFEVIPFLLPASGVNAPHERYRIWFVAYSQRNDDLRKERGGSGEAPSLEVINWKDYRTPWKLGRTDIHAAAGIKSYKPDVANTASDRRVQGEPHDETELGNQNGARCDASTYSLSTGRDISDANNHGDQQLAESAEGERSRTGDLEKPFGRHEHSKQPEQLSEFPWDDTNARSSGQQKFDATAEPAGTGHSTRFPIDQWNEWPTQPPLCHRDDGFPLELVGITFPRWRNEAIKAAGNAIVPQVALQIFKAINAYQKLTKAA